jgi:hypothetical protein
MHGRRGTGKGGGFAEPPERRDGELVRRSGAGQRADQRRVRRRVTLGSLAENIQPAFPFGHGLSYTTFRYDRLVARPLAAGADAARVRLRVENTGDEDGTEVVQVYAGPPPFQDAPERKLVGFAKVELDAGERAQVRIDVEREQLS